MGTVAFLAPADTRLDEVDPTNNMTPLMLATEHQQYAIIDVLLAAGADVNQPAANGWTVLHHAVDTEYDSQVNTGRAANLAVVKRLLDAGADAGALYRSPTGDQTPGELARQYGWIEAADLLDSCRPPHAG